MKYSGIGGQAVLEGVMMKNKEKYAVAVRKPDGEITVDTKEYYGLIKNKTLRNIPILRGVLSFVESLTLGISTLTYSASFFEEEEEDTKAKKKELSKFQKTLAIIGLILCAAGAIFRFSQGMRMSVFFPPMNG